MIPHSDCPSIDPSMPGRVYDRSSACEAHGLENRHKSPCNSHTLRYFRPHHSARPLKKTMTMMLPPSIARFVLHASLCIRLLRSLRPNEFGVAPDAHSSAQSIHSIFRPIPNNAQTLGRNLLSGPRPGSSCVMYREHPADHQFASFFSDVHRPN